MVQAYAKCQIRRITRTALQCETNAIDNMEKLINLHRPQCTNPRLLSLVLYSDAVTEVSVARFKSNFFGPYTDNRLRKQFLLLRKGKFCEHTRYLHSIGEASVEIPIGNISSLLQFGVVIIQKTFR